MLLRLCGKYIHLMKDLQPIASDVFRAMTQLLDFYVIVVYNFFTKDLVCPFFKVIYTVLLHIVRVFALFRLLNLD